jgi:hypothetical protein
MKELNKKTNCPLAFLGVGIALLILDLLCELV